MRNRMIYGVIVAAAVLGTAWGSGPLLAQPTECCVPGGMYGDGSDGDLYVDEYTPITLTRDMNYSNIVIDLGGVLDTAGFTVRVCGTLTNNGTITDSVSGGAGGGGGAGGLGANSAQDAVLPGCPARPVECTPGQPGLPGSLPSVPQTGQYGQGGQGGGGGGGGGGALYNVLYPKDADGGNGAAGGLGGKGGGHVRIYALRFENNGLIHADGTGGGPGAAAPNSSSSCGAQYTGRFGQGVPPDLYKDLAGGGGGGGAGGNGGNGGTVEYRYAYLVGSGTIRANGGPGGPGGSGGWSGTHQAGHSLNWGATEATHQTGCPGAPGGPAGPGGAGAHLQSTSAVDGGAGGTQSGAAGLVVLSATFNDCNGNGIPDECDVREEGIADLGTLPGLPAPTQVCAYGLNDRRLPTVVGALDQHTFVWDGGVMSELPAVTPASLTVAYAVNDADQVVGTDSYVHCEYPWCWFVWSALLWERVNGVWERTTLASGGMDVVHKARDINNLGHAVGVSNGNAVKWVDGSPEILGPGDAYGINDLNQVVGNSGGQGMLWDSGGARPLFSGTAYDINNSGQVVGEEDGYAILWDGFASSHLFPGAAYAINDQTQVVGVSNGHAVLWRNGILTDLNSLIPPALGWELLEARDINAAGQIVGYGTHHGLTRAFLLTPAASRDCDQNGVPDECEVPPLCPSCPDCNQNGIPDDCDIDPTDPDGNGQVSPDCNGNGIPDDCELTCNDCNLNGILDACEIADNPSMDANPQNGYLDDCDWGDCNSNGIADWWDIAYGDSRDCNRNGIPDECDIAAGEAGDCRSVDANGNGIPDECDSLGDMNCDDLVNGRDVQGFVWALIDPVLYHTELPQCFMLRGDMDFSGGVDMEDIPLFVTRLLQDP